METSTTTAKLYVGTYAKYNNGSIGGGWLDLADYSDTSEFLAACAELHNDETDPEFMFQDYEGFPSRFYGESMSETDLDSLFEYVQLMDELENADWLSLHNQYCENTSRHDDTIYNFDDEFFDMAFDGKPMEAARAASFGNLNWSDEYITFNGYGNLESISDLESYIDKDEIIEHIIENRNQYDI